MIDIILDTNVIIYFINGLPQGKPLLDALTAERLRFGISTVTEAEVFSKPGLTSEEQITIDEYLGYFKIVEVNSYIARVAAGYCRQSNLDLADALIAATARHLDIPLWTYNIKDFRRLRGVVLREPEFDKKLLSV